MAALGHKSNHIARAKLRKDKTCIVLLDVHNGRTFTTAGEMQMTKIRSSLLRKIAKESGANLTKLVRQFKNKSAVEIWEIVNG